MNLIYKGKCLSIKHNKAQSLFVQNWYVSPKDIEEFKFEMLEYTKLYAIHKPKHALWLQENFNIIICEATKDWIEVNVNQPCFEYGNEKCAFVVSRNVLPHIQTIDVFEKAKSCIIPKHFATQEEALQWFNGTNEQINTENTTAIVYDGIDSEGNVILKIPTKNIKETLKNIHNSVEQEKFVTANIEKAKRLTKREKEILNFISKNKRHQDIADTLFISLHTFRTHLKNIKKKLNCNSEKELQAFSKFLN